MMISVFKFMRLWDELTQEEKDYLEEEHGWSRYGKNVLKENELSAIEESLVTKGVLKREYNYYDDTITLKIVNELVWIFEGLTLTASFR